MFLKYLVDNRIKSTNGVRVIYGNDEESGFNDMKYYKRFYDTSELSFVLDNLFPVVDIEKGVINFDIIINNENNIKINGGTKRNVVAGDCEFINYSIDFKNIIKPKTFDKNIIEKLLKEYNDYYEKYDLPQKLDI